MRTRKNMFSVEENFIREQNILIKQLKKDLQLKEREITYLESQLQETNEASGESPKSMDAPSPGVSQLEVKPYLPSELQYYLDHNISLDKAKEPKPLYLTMICVSARNLLTLMKNTDQELAVALIREYYDIAISRLYQFQGRLDKIFTGTFFGYFGLDNQKENVGRAEAAMNALRFALGFESALDPLNIKLEEEGLPLITFGIGIHSGEVIATSIGNDHQSSIVLLGSEFSVTSGIESLNKMFNTKVILSSDTRSLVENLIYSEELNKVSVKDYHKDFIVYSLLGINEDIAPPGQPLDESVLNEISSTEDMEDLENDADEDYEFSAAEAEIDQTMGELDEIPGEESEDFDELLEDLEGVEDAEREDRDDI